MVQSNLPTNTNLGSKQDSGIYGSESPRFVVTMLFYILLFMQVVLCCYIAYILSQDRGGDSGGHVMVAGMTFFYIVGISVLQFLVALFGRKHLGKFSRILGFGLFPLFAAFLLIVSAIILWK